MRIAITILLSFLLLAKSSPAQTAFHNDSSFVLLKTYSGDIVDATLDNLDNLYIISSTGQIKKFNANGDSTGIFNQAKNSGKLFSVDVSNPLRPILFYKDFSTVVLLDRFLANRSILDLRQYDILQPGAVGLSYDNNIWVFDEYDSKLKKIDEQGNRLLETPDFRTVFNETVHPQKIINTDGFVYLADSANGVFVFDDYGTFKKKIPAKHWQNLTVKENYLIQTIKNEIVAYNTTTFTDTRKSIPASCQTCHSFSTFNRFVTFSADRLWVYRYRF